MESITQELRRRMEAQEVALSDIHLTVEKEHVRNILGYETFITNFKFYHVNRNVHLYTDEDGDFIVTRKCDLKQNECSIYIEHTLATRIGDVGLQIWPGCIVLCDFILSLPCNFDGKIVLELGAGIGLSSVILATVAKHVFSTDIENDLLSLCSKNIFRNNNLMKEFNRGESMDAIVSVRELDWEINELKSESVFGWTDEDKKLLSEVEVVVAADVVYNNKLTDALFKVLTSLLEVSPAKYVYISIEKRLNFTIDDMEVTCPAYDHFINCLKELKNSLHCDSRKITFQQVDTDFPQYFYQFPRTKYMELWLIKTSFHK